MTILSMRHLFIFFLVSVFLATSVQTQAGWFSDDKLYVIVQKTESGKYVDGWVTKGSPKNENGVYIFIIYRSTYEKRIPIQGTVVTSFGSDEKRAYDFLRAEREDLPIIRFTD